MAEADQTKMGDDEVEQQPAPKKNKRKLLVIVTTVVLLLVLAGSGAVLLLGKKKTADADGEEEVVATKEEKGHDQPPVYLKLDPFTTNLAAEANDQSGGGGGGQYIQVVVELKVEDAPAGEELKQYMPEIRNNILRLLSSKQPSQLATTEGKDMLANEIRESVNGVVRPPKKGSNGPRGPVGSVLFSSFIIQ